MTTDRKDGLAWAKCGVSDADFVSLRATNPAAANLVERTCHNDRSVASDALFRLKSEICHQGMAISATTPIVLPFLIALLSCRALTVRIELFQLVRQVAQASMAWRRAAADAGSLYAENYRERVKWEVAVDRIFVESRSRFEALRHDPDAMISQFADELAARFR